MRSQGPGKLKQRADEEAAAGRLWRAKELLRGAITAYDPELFEAFGRILLQMHDLKEAGKWLFLSGSRQPEYGEAIATFLAWCGGRGARKLYGSFPGCGRLPFVRQYPEPLATELRTLGIPQEVPEDWGSLRDGTLDGKALVGCLACGLAVGACVIVGAVVILRWSLSLLGVR
jgi:hypothetical protein